MLSTAKLNQLKLQHLHNASQTLFPSSPSVSAHLSTKMTDLAGTANIPLAESTWRKNCACCGYAMVPGWTASVRVRGVGGEGAHVSRERGKEKKEKKIKGTGTIGGVDGDDKNGGSEGSAVTITAIPSGTHNKVQMSTTSKAIRKRGKKRVRGKKHTREKTESREKEKEKEEDKTALQMVNLQADASVSAIPKPERIHKEPKIIAEKEPRVIYACKICHRKSIHSLPIKPTAQKGGGDKPSEQSVGDKAMTEKKQQQVEVSKLTPDTPGVTLGETSMTTTATAVSNTNATAKKRAKSRKNTLSEMLAKEAANRSIATSTSGFGLDLMDFMRTS
ncbi:hypothetical protein ABW20_dc0105204 [Dactylellina cionopaga]|nr:hypothetical protein ABW20_dc0105204 [Dactylellina cionopaga]